ncbi:exodeoxyribonuclease VII small subunit [uncultured Clostridium sp.]|jgi:exodeoxyribonuclease VII small subunit|uniref:exodeoxyribonuclease VII small subunit n=1 Tax=uncultured Clostridium sp. TaxID=59620 RepID=UPI002604CB7A|nr:exodeoxyribonuclease VII small subunit [uncultured Clostridium sp.]
MARKADSYEETYEKLEEIINGMERGELSLDESIKNYEEGVKLLNKLYKKLNSVEGKIKIVNNGAEQNFGGEE